MSYYFIEVETRETIIEYLRRPLGGIELAVAHDTVEESIALLLQRLDTYTLMPSLHPHIQPDHPLGKDGEPMKGYTKFFGNFEHISGTFSVITRDPDVIALLTVAIDANHKTHEYITAQRTYRAERDRKAEARR
jgi:hypothetical protein